MEWRTVGRGIAVVLVAVPEQSPAALEGVARGRDWRSGGRGRESWRGRWGNGRPWGKAPGKRPESPNGVGRTEDCGPG